MVISEDISRRHSALNEDDNRSHGDCVHGTCPFTAHLHEITEQKADRSYRAKGEKSDFSHGVCLHNASSHEVCSHEACSHEATNHKVINQEITNQQLMEHKPDRRRTSYTNKHRQFLEANAKGRSYEALAVLFNQEFGTDIGRLTISKLCRRFGISNGSTSRRPYTDEEIEFLGQNVHGMDYGTLAGMFNERFGAGVNQAGVDMSYTDIGIDQAGVDTSYTDIGVNCADSHTDCFDAKTNRIESNINNSDVNTNRTNITTNRTNITAKQIGELCRRKGFTNGLDNRYKPGHTVNIGRRLPHAAPDGTEYVNAAGYVMLKHNGVWRYKHIVIWEQANGKSVPKGCFIIFGDSDKCNFDIDNLFCVTASQSGMRNAMGLQGATSELAAVGVALAGLYVEVGGRDGGKANRQKKHK